MAPPSHHGTISLMPKLSRFQVEDLTLGMNNVDDPWELRAGESASLLNVVPEEGGHVIAARKGVQILQPGLGVSGRIEQLYYWASKGLVIVSHFGNIWSAPESTGTLTQRRVGTAARHDTPWCFEVMKGSDGTERLWGVNGIDLPQLWDGSAAVTQAWSTVGAGGAPPTGCTWVKLWKNRIVAGGNPNFPERIYYSDIGNPNSPNPYNFVDLRSAYDDNDLTSWADLIGDNLIVFKPQSSWVVYDSNTFANRRLGSPGCPHPFMSAEFRNQLYFLSASGLYSTNGEGGPVSEPKKLIQLNLSTPQLNSKGTRVVADFRDERIMILVPTGMAGNDPSSYDLIAYYPPQTRNNPHKEGTYFLLSSTPKMSSMVFFEDNWMNTTIFGEINNGQLWKGFLTEFDGSAGTAINSEWETGWIRLHPEERYERLRRINLRGQSTNPLTLSVRDGAGAASFSIAKTLSDDVLNRIRPEARGRQHKIQVAGTGMWRLRDMELVFRGGKEH